MKKTYLILLTGLIAGLTIGRVSAQDEAAEEPQHDPAVCEGIGIGIGIIPILPDDDGGAASGDEGTGGEREEDAPEPEVEVKEEPVEVKDGEEVCPEIYYMSAGGPLPYQRGDSAGTEADRDEAEEAPAPKFAKKSITDLVKKSVKPSAVKKNGRVFLRR